MKILLISGFLGAGKTTFIKAMTEATKRQFVVFENEFSDINIDGDILRNDTEAEAKPLDVYELTNGCICCNMKGDFKASLMVIQNSLDPDFLIIEPSGVAVLSSVIAGIRQIEYGQIQLLDPLAIVDATTFYKYREKYADIFTDQIKAATYVQLSKTEQCDEEEIAALVEEILAINPEAKVFAEHYRKAPPEYWQTLFAGELNRAIDGTDADGKGLSNFSCTDVSVPSVVDLMRLLYSVVDGSFGDICRAKGVVKVGDGKLRFDVVDGTFVITGAAEEDENNVIFIGQELAPLRMKAVLAEFADQCRKQ